MKKSSIVTAFVIGAFAISGCGGGGSSNVADANLSSNETQSGSYDVTKIELEYMKNNPSDKLHSDDCKAYKGGGDTVSLVYVGDTLQTPIVQGENSWSDVLSALAYDLAPSDNMYNSISECEWIQTVVESGSMDYDRAVEVSKMNSPNAFSDK